MATEYQFRDASGITRLDGTLEPDPAANSVPTGWSEDASDPANVSSNDGGLDLGAGTLSADDLESNSANMTDLFSTNAQFGLDGTATLGFYGTTAIVQPAAPVTLGDVITALQDLGLVAT